MKQLVFWFDICIPTHNSAPQNLEILHCFFWQFCIADDVRSSWLSSIRSRFTSHMKHNMANMAWCGRNNPAACDFCTVHFSRSTKPFHLKPCDHVTRHFGVFRSWHSSGLWENPIQSKHRSHAETQIAGALAAQLLEFFRLFQVELKLLKVSFGFAWRLRDAILMGFYQFWKYMVPLKKETKGYHEWCW